MSVILPWVGGFVEGGMVDGSIDKIPKNIFILKSNQIYVVVISFIIEEEIKKVTYITIGRWLS